MNFRNWFCVWTLQGYYFYSFFPFLIEFLVINHWIEMGFINCQIWFLFEVLIWLSAVFRVTVDNTSSRNTTLIKVIFFTFYINSISILQFSFESRVGSYFNCNDYHFCRIRSWVRFSHIPGKFIWILNYET